MTHGRMSHTARVWVFLQAKHSSTSILVPCRGGISEHRLGCEDSRQDHADPFSNHHHGGLGRHRPRGGGEFLWCSFAGLPGGGDEAPTLDRRLLHPLPSCWMLRKYFLSPACSLPSLKFCFEMLVLHQSQESLRCRSPPLQF